VDVTIFLPRGGALLGFPAFFEGLRFFAQTFLYVLFGWGWEMSWFHWVREYGGEIGRVVYGVWYWVLRRLVLKWGIEGWEPLYLNFCLVATSPTHFYS